MAELKERMKGRDQELGFYICSNGTVMNDDIRDFLLENNFNLQISIDGDQQTHDSKRKFKSTGTGSFGKIVENLQTLYDRDPAYFETQVKMKSVVTTDSLDSDGRNFFKHPLIKILNEKGRITLINQAPQHNVEKDGDFFERMRRLSEILLQKKDMSTLEELTADLNYQAKGLFYSTFYEFFTIQVMPRMYFGPGDPVPFSKDCLIGIEGCVNVDGSMSICYKSNSFIIGNVHEQTWYFDAVEEYHTKRYSRSESCKHCYLQRFCNMCYDGLSAKDGRLEESLNNYCNFKRHYFRVIFETMLQIMENNPNMWDVLEDMADKEDKRLKRENASEGNAPGQRSEA
ncbi:MAG: hypothetical protein GY765_11110 [bacterium]|nr:hypothetical protein [bacterium]